MIIFVGETFPFFCFYLFLKNKKTPPQAVKQTLQSKKAEKQA
jgi:hypothetical protein